jgi:hypothetical protein
MKKVILFAICAIFAMVSKAQTNTDELKYLQDVIGVKKKQYVEEHVKISPADAAKFWKLYDEYELFRSEIGEKRVDNINEYITNYGKLTNAKADELMNRSFAVGNEMAALWQKTYTKMSKELSPVLASEFILVEMFLEAKVRVAATEQAPNMGGSKK